MSSGYYLEGKPDTTVAGPKDEKKLDSSSHDVPSTAKKSMQDEATRTNPVQQTDISGAARAPRSTVLPDPDSVNTSQKPKLENETVTAKEKRLRKQIEELESERKQLIVNEHHLPARRYVQHQPVLLRRVSSLDRFDRRRAARVGAPFRESETSPSRSVEQSKQYGATPDSLMRRRYAERETESRELRRTRYDNFRDLSPSYRSTKSYLLPTKDDIDLWWKSVNETDDMESRFKDSIMKQDSDQRRRGRAAVIDCSWREAKIFRAPKELAKHLERESFPPRALLIILEDLSRDWIEVLGPGLGMPPNVFALHHTKPDDHILGNVRIPLGTTRNQHFILSYKQPLPIKIYNKRKDVYYRVACNAHRVIAPSVRDRDTETCEQLVSFWSPKSGSYSVHAVLLVDPPLTDTGHSIIVEPRRAGQEVTLNSAVCDPAICPPLPMLNNIPTRSLLQVQPGMVERISFTEVGKDQTLVDQPLNLLSRTDEATITVTYDEHVKGKPERQKEITDVDYMDTRPKAREYEREEIIRRTSSVSRERGREREYEIDDLLSSTEGRRYRGEVTDHSRGFDRGYYDPDDIIIRRGRTEMAKKSYPDLPWDEGAERVKSAIRRSVRNRSRETERDIERANTGQKTTRLGVAHQESNHSLDTGRAQQGHDSLLSKSASHSLRSSSPPSFTETRGPSTPEGISMFEDLVYFDQSVDFDIDLANLTSWCRRLVLARTAAAMHTVLLETISLAATSAVGLEDITDFSYDTFEKNAWTTQWTGAKFTQLWEQREDLELMRFKLHQSIKTIRALTVENLGTDDRRLYMEPALRESGRQEKEDLREWEELESIGEYMFQIIARTTDSYLQTVQAGEAQMSNRQERRVGQLTSLATFFVPFSVVAAIFSVTGSFAVGAKNFWVYWVVAVPITIFVLLSLFTGLGPGVLKLWEKTTAEFAQSWRRASGYRDEEGGTLPVHNIKEKRK